MVSKQKKVILYLVLLGLLIVIVLCTLLPSYLIKPIRRYVHIKTGHKMAYFTLTGLLTFILRTTTQFKQSIAYCGALLLATSFGALLELGQRFTLTREGNVKDIGINFIGGLIGTCACCSYELGYCLLQAYKKSRATSPPVQ